MRPNLAIVFAALVLALASCSPPPAEQHSAGHPASADPDIVDSAFPPAMRELSFESGGSKLNGLMYIADGPGPHPTVVLLHGYPGNERNLDLAQAMRRAHMNVLYFNYRGTWGSGGEFSIPHALEDVAKAVELARDEVWASVYRSDPDKVALVGHSFGGFLGAITTAENEDISCFAFLAGADMGTFGALARDNETARAGFESALGLDMDAAGGPINGNAHLVVEEIVDRVEAYDVPSHASALVSRPLLVVGGQQDEALPKAEHHDRVVAALRAAGAERLTEVVFDDDHVFSAHRVELAQQLIDWQQAECWH